MTTSATRKKSRNCNTQIIITSNFCVAFSTHRQIRTSLSLSLRRLPFFFTVLYLQQAQKSIVSAHSLRRNSGEKRTRKNTKTEITKHRKQTENVAPERKTEVENIHADTHFAVVYRRHKRLIDAHILCVLIFSFATSFSIFVFFFFAEAKIARITFSACLSHQRSNEFGHLFLPLRTIDAFLFIRFFRSLLVFYLRSI